MATRKISPTRSFPPFDPGVMARLNTVANNFIFLNTGLQRMSAALDNLTTQVSAALAEISALVTAMQGAIPDDSSQLNSLASQLQSAVAAAQAAVPPPSSGSAPNPGTGGTSPNPGTGGGPTPSAS